MKEKKVAFLSNNLCQDPLEKFFGCQRQRGGTSDNPNVLEFYQNTQALRVIDSLCQGPVRGNSRKRPRDPPTSIEKGKHYSTIQETKKALADPSLSSCSWYCHP